MVIVTCWARAAPDATSADGVRLWTARDVAEQAAAAASVATCPVGRANWWPDVTALDSAVTGSAVTATPAVSAPDSTGAPIGDVVVAPRGAMPVPSDGCPKTASTPSQRRVTR